MGADEKKLTIRVALAVIVVSAVAILLLTWFLSNPNILVAEEPKFRLEDLHNMAPEDGSVLVAFQGFARYLSDEYGTKQYLALAPVTGINVTGKKTQQEVRFESALGSVSMSIADGITNFYIKNIAIYSNDGDEEKTCYISDPGIFYKRDFHYECFKRHPANACMRSIKDKNGIWTDVEVAELTISAIRLETTGDAEEHKSGRFTHEATFCKIP